MMDLWTKRLYEFADEKYRVFMCSLIKNMPIERMIGVRMPTLRKLYKELYRNNRDVFIKQMDCLPNKYYEFDAMIAIYISGVNDVVLLQNYLDKFLPFVDNWAICDMISPEIISQNLDSMYPYLLDCLLSEHTYTIRFAIVCFLRYYQKVSYVVHIDEYISRINHLDYYVQMAQSWYFATALANDWRRICYYLENRLLNPVIHRRTIQKAIESHLIAPEKKLYLKTLR